MNYKDLIEKYTTTITNNDAYIARKQRRRAQRKQRQDKRLKEVREIKIGFSLTILITAVIVVSILCALYFC